MSRLFVQSSFADIGQWWFPRQAIQPQDCLCNSVTMRTILDVLGRCQCTLGSKIKMEGSSKTKETAADLDNRVRWSESATDMTDMLAKVQMSSTDGYGDQW